MRLPHEIRPDLGGQARSGDLFRGLAIIIPHPDRRHELRGIANEPRIAVVLGGAGLASGGMAGNIRTLGGAADQCFPHHPVHHADMGGIHYLPDGRAWSAVEHLALGRLDLEDDMRNHAHAAIGQHGIGACDFQRRDFRCAERQRFIRLQCGIDSKPLRGPDNLARSYLDIQFHGDRVQRHRQRLSQRDLPEILLRVVFWPPAADIDRRILTDRVRRQALFQGCEIDKWLEGGAGLPFGGHGAVELALCIIPAAQHRPHGTVSGHRHQGRLLDIQLAALRLERGREGLFCHGL